jgi:hypothetical protein
MTFKLPKTAERDDLLGGNGIETLAYDPQYTEYRVRIDPTLDDSQRGIILGMAREARESYRK